MQEDLSRPRNADPATTGSRDRLLSRIALGVALLVAGVALALPQRPAPSTQAAPPQGNLLHDRWPDARVVSFGGPLADGRAYTPLLYPDIDVSVGTALTSDGAQLRLLVRTADGTVRELMRLATADNPQFSGLTAAGDDLVWLTSSGGGDPEYTLYHTRWRRPGPATPLTTDTGRVELTDTQYDLVLADGLVYWAAATTSGTTEIRSVPVTGGDVTTRTVDGAYALSAWPWLTPVGSAVVGPIELRNLVTGQRIAVARTPPEVVSCGPVWCRVMTPGPDGRLARTDLMHPDGTGRIRVAAGSVSAAISDIALLDRFEVLVSTTPDASTDTFTLVLYDLTTNRSTVLADAAATVRGHGSIVWWSTGDDGAVTWYALDLRSLR
jgi:hypothetical protein